MVTVKANIQSEHYTTKLTAQGHSLVADEPKEHGGTDTGFSPSELLAASLSACTAITCRMYADRKEWKLDGVDVQVELQTNDGVAQFSRLIHFLGELDEAQKERLTQIANNCPIHKILRGTIQITTEIL